MTRSVAVAAALLLSLLTVSTAQAGSAPTPTPATSPSVLPSSSPSPLSTAGPQVGSPASPSPSANPSPSPSASPSPDPNRPLRDNLKERLGSDLARTLAAEQRLNAALDRGNAEELVLSDRIDTQANLVSDLRDQVAKLDDQISTTQDRVATQQSQVAGLARAMARRPRSWLLVLARAGNLHEALVESADLIAAGRHAEAVQARLQAELDRLDRDRAARMSDLDRELAAQAALNASLAQLQSTLNRQGDIAAQLGDLESQLNDALAALGLESPAAAAELAKLLESQQANLDQAARELAWGQAQIGSGRLQIGGLLPATSGPTNLKLAWPEPGAAVSQPFGPSDLLLEPPLGVYPHFHTGIDIAAVEFTPVLAAADGVVVAAAMGKLGYGNYIVLAHGSGLETLYGHLSEIKVAVGDRVTVGEPIGLEGSSGFSTGPHLHFELRLNGQVLDPMPYLPLLNKQMRP